MRTVRWIAWAALMAVMATGGALPSTHAADAEHATEWLAGKDLVHITYERNRWEPLSKLSAKVRQYRSPDLFRLAAGESGGKTVNFVHCSFRVNPDNRRTFERLHKQMTTMGFAFQKGSPSVLAYAMSPKDKQRIRKEIADARQDVVKRASRILPGFGPHCVKGRGLRYQRRGVSVLLDVSDLWSTMPSMMRSIVPALTIYLPSFGHKIQLYVVGSGGGRLKTRESRDMVRAVREAFRELVKRDGRATVWPEGDR